jgi:hypothetical protein
MSINTWHDKNAYFFLHNSSQRRNVWCFCLLQKDSVKIPSAVVSRDQSETVLGLLDHAKRETEIWTTVWNPSSNPSIKDCPLLRTIKFRSLLHSNSDTASENNDPNYTYTRSKHLSILQSSGWSRRKLDDFRSKEFLEERTDLELATDLVVQ